MGRDWDEMRYSWANQQDAQTRQMVGFLQTVKPYAYIYPLSRIRECMRGMVCVTGGEGCGDTGPSRVQEG